MTFSGFFKCICSHKKYKAEPELFVCLSYLSVWVCLSESLLFGSLVFLEITYNDSMQQCLISSRGRIYEKIMGQRGQNRVQN